MSEDKNKNFKKVFYNVMRYIEWGIILLLLITILFTFKEIVMLLIHEILNGNLLNHYKMLLSEILLLAVGIEIAILIIKKDVFLVIDIIILAIARKLITYEDSMDILISVICILILVLAKWLKNYFKNQID